MMDADRLYIMGPDLQPQIAAIKLLMDSELLDESEISILVERLGKYFTSHMVGIIYKPLPMPRYIIDAFEEPK